MSSSGGKSGCFCRVCGRNDRLPVEYAGTSTGICSKCLKLKYSRPSSSKNSQKNIYVPPADSPLVNSSISRHKKTNICNKVKSSRYVVGFAVYKSSVKVLRNFKKSCVEAVPERGEVDSFSAKSKARLKFCAANADPSLVSQFCLTYHEMAPKDGKAAKKHLDNFLRNLRRNYDGIKYLWVLEFQSSGHPHYHLFLSISVTKQIGKDLAAIWNRVTNESEEHLKFHSHSKNFMKWDMGSGSYLAKYLDKEYQKVVPIDYFNVGRFWGASRGLVPDPIVVSEEQLTDFDGMQFDTVTGEEKQVSVKKYITRALGKLHQKRLNPFGKTSRVRKTPTSILLSCMAVPFWQLYQHLYTMRELSPPF